MKLISAKYETKQNNLNTTIVKTICDIAGLISYENQLPCTLTVYLNLYC